MSKNIKVLVSAIIAANVFMGGISTISYADDSNACSKSLQTEKIDNSQELCVNEDNSVEKSSEADDYGLAENSKDGVILHAWCWSFNTIKDNMKDIAEAGYTTVQTSPANNIVYGEGGGMCIYSDGGGKWVYQYQPTDWKIGNYMFGSRDEFKAMCDEATKYGVKIIVDVVPNHTTTDTGSVSQDLYNSFSSGKAFHKDGFNGIGDYNNRQQCTLMSVGSLPDVNTEDPGFQKYFLDYLNDLIDCGASGFRYDTAKHIGLPDDPQDDPNVPNTFWPVVTGEESVDGVSLKNKDNLFIYGEILQDANVRETDYAKYFSMTASDYGWHIDGAIKDKNFEVGRVSDWSHKCSPDKLVTWVESHDTYCNEGKTKDMTDWQIKMCWAVLAARDGGTPLFYDRPAGAGNGNWWGNNKIGEKGSDLFKDPEVAAVNKFRNAMIGEKENLVNPDGNNKILMIERGDKGATIINLGEATTISCKTNIADGTYKDTVSGNEFTVDGGILTADLEKEKVACIYDGQASTKPRVSASFKEKEFKTDTLDVTLNTKNTKSATYSIDGGAETPFKDGDIITVGKDAEYDTPIKLSLKGASEDGAEDTKDYEFIKKDPDDCTRAYLKLPKDWAGAYVYLYDGSDSSKNNGEWPGAEMTKVEGEEDLYYYDIPEGYEKPLIIYNEGTGEDAKKYPDGEKAPGEEITGQMICDGTSFEKYIKKNKDKEISNTSFEIENKDDLVINKDVIFNIKAQGGNGTLKYDLEITKDDEEVYTKSGKIVDGEEKLSYPPDKKGKYIAKVTISDENGKTKEQEIEFTVNEEKKEEKPIVINGINVNDGDKIQLGNSIDIKASAEGGNGELSYNILIKDSDDKEIKSSKQSSYKWTPEKEGKYKIVVTVTDKDGCSKDEEATVEVIPKKIIDKLDLIISSFKANDEGNGVYSLEAKATGNGLLTYKFYNITNGKNELLSNENNESKIKWTANENGTYEFKVVVYDEDNLIEEEKISIKVSSIVSKDPEKEDSNVGGKTDPIKEPVDSGKVPDNEDKTEKEDGNANGNTSDNKPLVLSILGTIAASYLAFTKKKKINK